MFVCVYVCVGVCVFVCMCVFPSFFWGGRTVLFAIGCWTCNCVGVVDGGHLPLINFFPCCLGWGCRVGQDALVVNYPSVRGVEVLVAPAPCQGQEAVADPVPR